MNIILRPVFFLVVFSTTLAGCVVGPNYTPLEPQAPAQWQLDDDSQLDTAQVELDQWWTNFQDDTLSEFVTQVRQQNLSLRIAGLRILQVRALLGISKANYYPFSQANGSVTLIDGSENSANAGFGDDEFTDASLTLDSQWEFDFWGRFRRDVEASKAVLERDMANFADVLVLITAETARTYTAVRLLEERLRLARLNEANQDRALQVATARFDNGATTELDVAQAGTILGATRAAIPGLETELRLAVNALMVLLNQPRASVEALLAQATGIPVAPEQITVGIPADMLRRRPDVQIAERNLAAQSAAIGVAVADLYPRFSLAGSVGFQSSDASSALSSSDLGGLFETGSVTSFIGPFVSWNVFNFGRIKNNIRVQDAAFQQLLETYRNTVLQALAESDNAIVAFENSKLQTQNLQFSADAAERSVELATIQYQEGQTDFNRVVAALDAANIQLDSLAQSQGAIVVNLIDLYRALGGGWQSFGQDYVPEGVQQEMLQRTNYWNGQFE